MSCCTFMYSSLYIITYINMLLIRSCVICFLCTCTHSGAQADYKRCSEMFSTFLCKCSYEWFTNKYVCIQLDKWSQLSLNSFKDGFKKEDLQYEHKNQDTTIFSNIQNNLWKLKDLKKLKWIIKTLLKHRYI